MDAHSTHPLSHTLKWCDVHFHHSLFHSLDCILLHGFLVSLAPSSISNASVSASSLPPVIPNHAHSHTHTHTHECEYQRKRA